MDTTERRLKLARQLRQLADMVTKAEKAYDFDLILDELHQLGNDANGYHQRTLAGMYDEQGED